MLYEKTRFCHRKGIPPVTLAEARLRGTCLCIVPIHCAGWCFLSSERQLYLVAFSPITWTKSKPSSTHQAHCFLSPFCKVQTLRVVEAGKEITTAERFVFSKCAVSTWDPCCSTVTNQRQSRAGHGPLSVTPVPGPDSNFTVFRAPLPEVHRAVGTDVCWGDISDMDGRI